MNVLMVGLYPPHIGGISSYVSSLKTELESLNINVYVVTYGKSSDPRVYGTFVLPCMRGLSFLVTGTRKVYQVIQKEDIDLIHAHYLVPPGLVGVFTKKLSRTPLVVTCHGSDIFVFSTGWKKLLSKYVLKSSDCIVCNSRAMLNAANELYNSRSVYIPSGIDLNQFTPLNMKREAVTYVGALTPVKGVDIFLRAIEGTHEPVWIIGDGPEKARLEALAHKLNISCTFWGFRTDICELMNRSKIVVLPSRNEGFGLTLLEAMACGTPVIGRKTGGIPEIITGENGLLFEREEELHQKIRTLLEDKDLWERMREEGLKTASQWSWERTARTYMDLYSSLI